MDSSVTVSPPAGARASVGYGLLCGWLVLLLVLRVLARFSATSVMDDAFMFARHAEQWLASGQLRFNPGDSPTYGLTSPGFLLVVAPIRALLPGSPALVASLASLGCAIAACAACVALVAKGAGRGPGTRRLAVAGVVIAPRTWWQRSTPAEKGVAFDALRDARHPEVAPRTFQFDMNAEYLARWSHDWPLLDRVPALPRPAVIATTEVGRIVGMNPGRVVVDLAGLNETSIARAGFDPGTVLERYRSDVVYLPHPHYVSFRRRLFADAAYRRDDRVWSEDALGSLMGVALRRDGRWFGPLATAFDSVAAAQAPGP